MPDVKGLVNDPEFKALSADDKRAALAGIDPDFSSLSHDDVLKFESSLSGHAQPSETVQKEVDAGLLGGTGAPMSREDASRLSQERSKKREAMEGNEGQGKFPSSLGQDLLSKTGEQLYKSIPVIPNAVDEYKEGMKNGKQIAGDNMLGRIVGGQIAAARVLPTVFNPLFHGGGEALEMIPKGARAVGSLAGGDIDAALKDIEGVNGHKSGIQLPYANTGSELIDTALNTPRNIAQEVADNPLLLATKFKGALKGADGPAFSGWRAPIADAISDTVKAGAEKVSDAASRVRNGTIEQHGEAYRELLAPTKGDVQNVEVKGGKNIQDSFNLAAENKLKIQKTADNKLDTTKAREQLEEKINPIEDELQESLAAAPQRQFSIRELAEEAKKQARERFDNDLEYEEAVKEIDKNAEATIRQQGEYINGSQLNKLKRVMWKKGYNATAPNAHEVARVIGNVAKDAIETAYTEADIKGLNAKLGEYATLDHLLKNAQGRVINKGKVGKYVAQILGGVIGSTVPVAGTLGGWWAGGKINDYFTSPERITGNIARKVERLQANEPKPVQPSSAERLEAMMQDLATKAQRQRLAEAIKEQELNNQAKQDLIKKSALEDQSAARNEGDPSKAFRELMLKRFRDAQEK